MGLIGRCSTEYLEYSPPLGASVAGMVSKPLRFGEFVAPLLSLATELYFTLLLPYRGAELSYITRVI